MHKLNSVFLWPAGVISIVLLVAWFNSNNFQDQPENFASQNSINPTLSSRQTAPGYESAYGKLPESIHDLPPLPALAVDENGHLRISSDIKQAFDYFLTAMGQESLEVILARIHEYLDFTLSEPALSEAKTILINYINLKTELYEFEQAQQVAMNTLMSSNGSQKQLQFFALIEDQFSKQGQLRLQHLSAQVYEAFYQDEEHYDQYVLARLKVQSDSQLSIEEKQLQLDQIDQLAPSDLVESRQKNRKVEDLSARTQELAEQGASEEEIQQLRTELVGHDAAQRLVTLDNERNQWNLRVGQYLQQRKQILATEGLTLEERQQQVESLRASEFNAREQIRVQVAER